jgi:hypothetical protein
MAGVVLDGLLDVPRQGSLLYEVENSCLLEEEKNIWSGSILSNSISTVRLRPGLFP